MNPYDRLAELAEHELTLVSAGAMEELPSIYGERDEILAALPPRPPAEARGALERAALLQDRVTATLAARMREVVGELQRVSTGRAVIHGYQPALAPRHRLDLTG
jgi:hypothetical protein